MKNACGFLYFSKYYQRPTCKEQAEGIGILLFYSSASWAIKIYMPFQVGVAYMVAGVFIGRDLKYIGLAMIITSLLSLLMPCPIQDIWLAIIGGGGLVLTGLIFKNQVKKSG